MPSLPEAFPDLPPTVPTPLGSVPLEGLTALILGVLLLAFGRRLYWLTLLGVGFLGGLLVADRFAHTLAADLRLVLALAAGVAGAVLAFVAQKVAVQAAGAFAGAAIAFAVVPLVWPAHGVWLWPLTAVGGVLGLGVAKSVFDLALLLLTCGAGALLVSRALPLSPIAGMAVAGVLFVVGLVFQGRGDFRGDDD